MMNKLVEWLFGGINSPMKKEGYNRLDIVYPAYNNTNGWFITPRWDLILKVNKKGEVLHYRCIYDYSIVETLEIIKQIGE